MLEKEEWGEHWHISLDSRAPRATDNLQSLSFPKKQVKKLKVDKPFILKHRVDQTKFREAKKNILTKLKSNNVIPYFFLVNQIESIWKIKVNQNESLRFVRFESESK